METQKTANFLDCLEFAGETDGTFFSVVVTAIGSKIMYLYVCDDVAFATSGYLVWLLSRIPLSGT